MAEQPKSGKDEQSGDSRSEGVQPGWYLRVPEGLVYGPVSRLELDRWVREGRIDADCSLRSDSGTWRRASEVYPELEEIPTASLANVAARSRATPIPHRGPLLLSLALLSWCLILPVLSPWVWRMARSDLADMQHGRIDPSGGGSTHAAYVLALIHVLLSLLAMLLAPAIYLAAVFWNR